MRASIQIAGVLWLAALALGVAAPAAGAYVYWANSEKETIGRGANDGSVVEPNFIIGAGEVGDVAVDSGHIYWADTNGDSIGRANLDGTAVNPSFIKNVGNEPDGVAVNAGHIYWSAASGNIGRAKIDGSSPEPEFLKGADPACGLALDAGHIYWSIGTTEPVDIGRAPLSGGTFNPEYVKVPKANFICGVAVNTTSIFWADGGLGGGTNIGRANLSDGEGVDESFIGQASGPCGIAILGSQIYWDNSGTSTIARANTDSSGVDYELFNTGAEPKRICGIAVDALAPSPKSPAPPGPPGGRPDTTAPQTTITKGPGKKLAKGKAKFSFASSEAGSSFQCKLDKKKVAGCRSPRGYSGLKPGRHTFTVWATDAAGNKDPTPAKRGFRVPG